MTLLDQIKADSLQARKDRNGTKASLLVTLHAEALSVGKNDGNRDTTEEETIRTVKKFIKGVDESLKYTADTHLMEQKAYLETYLPTQLNEDDLKKAIKELIVANPNITMGSLMAGLKSAYAGLYDGVLASKLVKEFLNG